MALNVLQTLESRKTPQLNEIEYFANMVEAYLDEATPIETVDIHVDKYEIIDNPFKKGTSLAIRRTSTRNSREISLFPMIYLGGAVSVSEVFSEKTPRLTFTYSRRGEAEELTGFNISSFEGYDGPNDLPWIRERSLKYKLDNEEQYLKTDSIEIAEYLRKQGSKMKMYALQRLIKVDNSFSKERLYGNIDSSISNGIWFVKEFIDSVESAFLMQSEFEFFRVRDPLLIIKPYVFKGVRVTNPQEMNNFEGIVQELGKMEVLSASITQLDRMYLHQLYSDGIELPTFED